MRDGDAAGVEVGGSGRHFDRELPETAGRSGSKVLLGVTV